MASGGPAAPRTDHRRAGAAPPVSRELTLRQIEVIRAVMLTGTISGAAEMLGVSAPGVSRLIRHTEDSLRLRLFERRAGLFVPAAQAAAIFEQVQRVHAGVAALNQTLASLGRGQDGRLSFASAPSIAQFIAARAIRGIRRQFPDLVIDLNILKIEETVDYLLLERGEFVVMSSPVRTPAVESTEIAQGVLVAIVPEGHALAGRGTVSVRDLAREPLIGVDPDDPYGAILARPFREAALAVDYAIRGRFAQTVVSLVRHGLGVAVIDEFSVAEVYMPGLVRLCLAETVPIGAHVLTKKDRSLSSFAERAIAQLRQELIRATANRAWEATR
jgi:DNA-binding transcriptional LysR family regulator